MVYLYAVTIFDNRLEHDPKFDVFDDFPLSWIENGLYHTIYEFDNIQVLKHSLHCHKNGLFYRFDLSSFTYFLIADKDYLLENYYEKKGVLAYGRWKSNEEAC